VPSPFKVTTGNLSTHNLNW